MLMMNWWHKFCNYGVINIFWPNLLNDLMSCFNNNRKLIDLISDYLKQLSLSVICWQLKATIFIMKTAHIVSKISVAFCCF